MVMSWNKKIIVNLVIPSVAFLALFTFFQGFFRVYAACDCFFNYREWIFYAMIISFSVGASILVHSLKKNNKNFKFLYTILGIGLFLIIYYVIMTLGELLYVPVGFGF